MGLVARSWCAALVAAACMNSHGAGCAQFPISAAASSEANAGEYACAAAVLPGGLLVYGGGDGAAAQSAARFA